MLHHVRDRHRRAPRHAHAAVHEHLAARLTRLLDPRADRVQLVLERVDPVVAHAFDIEHLDPPFALFDPEGTRPLSGDALPLNGTDRRDITSSTVHLRGRYERTFADGDDMRDAQRMQHIRIRSVISAHPMSQYSPRGELKKKKDLQVPKIQKREYPTGETSIEPRVVEPTLMIRYERR